MWGIIIGDMVGAEFEGKLNTDYRFDLSQNLKSPTAVTALVTAAAELCCCGFKPDGGKAARFLAAREIAGRQKTYLIRSPQLADEPRKKWISNAGMRRCIVAADFAPLLAVPFISGCESIEQAADCAELACAYISNCSESVKAARAGAAAVFAAAHGVDKTQLAEICEPLCEIHLCGGYDEVQEQLLIDGGAVEFVQAAFAAVQKGYDFDSTIRFAAAMGRGASCVCALAGAICEASGDEIDIRLVEKARQKLDVMTLRVVERFVNYGRKV